jgi:hypothetical protein
MKLLRQFVRLWFGNRKKTRTPGQPVPENPGQPSIGRAVRKSKRPPPGEDDSPPGCKIRWYH